MIHLSLADIRYRLITLRRMNVLGVLLVGVGVWLAQMLSGGQALGGYWPSVVAVGVLGVMAHNVIFPAGWMEGLSLPFSALLTLAAYGGMSVTGVVPPAVMILSAAVLFAALTLGCVVAIGALHGRFPAGQLRRKSSVHLDVSAQAFADWAFERPSETHGTRRTGKTGPDGLIPVWHDFRGPNEANGFDASAPFAPINRAPDAYLRILERSETHQVIQSVMPGEDASGAPRMSMTHTSITATGRDSCLVTEREVHNLYDVVTHVMAWLQDASRDYYRDASDLIQGRPTPAIRRLPQDTLLASVARFFVAMELAS